MMADDFSVLQTTDTFVPPPAKWGGRHTVTLIPGDGIGPEMANHVKELFRYAGAPVDFEEIDLDSTTPDVEGFEYALMSIKRNGVALKGTTENPVNVFQFEKFMPFFRFFYHCLMLTGNIETRTSFQGFQSRNVVLRNRLGLFANVVCVKNIPGIRAKQKDVDIVIIRENLEAEYSGIEHEVILDWAMSLKKFLLNRSL